MDTGTYLVFYPEQQLSYAIGDLLLPGLLSFGLCGLVDGFGSLFFLHLFLFFLNAFVQPFADPGRFFCLLKKGRLTGAQEEETQAMFAGKFAAGAGAFESEIGQVYLCLVGFAAAALAFAPERSCTGGFAHPFGGIGKVFTGFFRRFVRGKG